MKKMLILLCCCLSLTVSSQLPNGIIAPDFTATDLNGNSWHLYDLLDQGKSVVKPLPTQKQISKPQQNISPKTKASGKN